jgi:hypothetical protein
MNIKICDFFHGAASPAATPIQMSNILQYNNQILKFEFFL